MTRVNDVMKICLGILTTATRKETLDLCVKSVSDLIIPISVNFEVLIVENADSHSKLVGDIIDKNSQVTINKVLENRKGIPFGRNCALDYAISNKINYLGFVDDDAVVDKNWLVNMVGEIVNVEAVTGPQIPVFPENTEKKFMTANVYQERKLENRSLCKWAATNNVIFDVSFANKNKIRFSEDMKTGGSDKEFFRRFSSNGGKIVWVKNAVVKEFVEKERINTKWAVKRNYRFGGTGYRIERSVNGVIESVFICFFKGGVYFSRGIVLLFLSLFFMKINRLNAKCDIAHGIAFIVGVLKNGKLKEYT